MKQTHEIVRNPVIESEPELVPAGRYPLYRDVQTSDGFQLVDYWRAIRKRLWLVIGIAVLVTTLAAIYMARKPSIFMARAIVQVDNEQINPDLVTNDRQRAISTSDPSYFNTQLQLLSSDNLLRRTIKEKNLDASKEFQLAKNEGSVSPWWSILRSLGLATDDNKKDKTSSAETTTSDASVGASEDIAEAVRLSPYVNIIKQNIEIDPIRDARMTFKDTRLIGISFRHTSPEFAAHIANSVAETFRDANQEKRSGASGNTSDYLREQISSLNAEIQADEQTYVNWTQNAGILKTGEGEQTIVNDRLSGLNKQLLEAEFARKSAEANYLTVSKSPEQMQSLAAIEMARYTTEQENNIRALESETLKKVADLQQTRALRLQEYKETAPEILEIEAQINSLEGSIGKAKTEFKSQLDTYRQNVSGDILNNLRTKYLQAKGQEDKIRVDFNKQFGEAQGQDQSAVRIKLLQQKLETKKGFLDNLTKQVSGNDIASKGAQNNISVIDPAIPSDAPVSPRRLMTVVAALFLSTLFGMGLALFLEYLDDTIRTTEEVENYLQLPALAAIPTMDSMPRRKLALVGASEEDGSDGHSPLLISSDPRSSLAEAYRHLRTSILLSTAGRAPRSLLITSSLPSEGKTTTATNTAISLAQTGAKVLIMDADMRRPRLHSIFGVDNAAGLSTLLASELSDSEIDRTVKQDEKSQLYLMTSGPIPPNPAELIGSEQMASLMRMLQTKFTHVVVDSPPIASFTDGVLIASMVDGVVLVVHAGKSSRQVVRRSRQLLNEIGAKIFGVLLNNVNLNNKDNYYYYQSYYHRSNYVSGDESN